jgi:hypothetical protein
MAREGDIVDVMFKWMIELLGWIFKMFFNLAVWVFKMLWKALTLLVMLIISAFRKEQPKEQSKEQQTAESEKPTE